MDDAPIPQPVAPEALDALNRRTAKLEFLLLLSLAVIIILGVGLNILLANQVKGMQARYNEQTPIVKQLAKSWRETDEPLYRNFINALQQYATTSKDFQPILDKYRPAFTNFLTAAKPTAPAPAAQPAKK